jgi:hypothetical protein
VWLTAAAVPSPELVNLDVTRSVEGRVMAKAVVAAPMVRARPAVGLGEGKRMRVVLVLNLRKGRRYSVVGVAVRHGEKNELHEVKGGEERVKGEVI